MTEDRSQWRPFIERTCEAAGVDPTLVEVDQILDLTREVAHGGSRPMAPVSAYILGLALGSGKGSLSELRAAIQEAAVTAPRPKDL